MELRKLVDTRAGRWLLITIGLVAAAIVALQLVCADDADQTFTNFFVPSLLPVGVLLPVLGILSITSEWSQRTALTTFALVPRRERVVVAKLTAVVLAALASVLVSLAVAAVGTLVAVGHGRRGHLAARRDAGVQRGDLPGHRRADGRGVRPAAAQHAAGDRRLPAAADRLGGARRDGPAAARRRPAGWTPATMEPLFGPDVTGGQWGRLAVSLLVWVVAAAGRRAGPDAAPRGVLTMDVAGYRPRTVVSGGPVELAVMWGGFPLLGAGVGWLLAAATGWLARLPWVPFRDWSSGWTGCPSRRPPPARIAVGVLAGLVVAGIGTAERLIVTVDAAQVRLRRAGEDRTVAGPTPGWSSSPTSTWCCSTPTARNWSGSRRTCRPPNWRAAFRAHGWGWADDDPHRSAYRLWVPGLPGLPAGADALLRARERAIERDRRDDARELRRELGLVGVVLRGRGQTAVLAADRPGRRPGTEQPTSAEREPDGR